jgi:hypothetical protein
VAAHEAGHLAGGRAVGFAPRLAQVGPVVVRRVGRRWYAEWDWRQPWLDGRVFCDVRRPDRWRLAVYVAAGPAASLLAGAAAVGLAVAADVPLVRGGAGLFAVHSAFFGAVNLLPMRVGRLHSDGLALWRLLAAGRVG